jgi:hypothetical protein
LLDYLRSELDSQGWATVEFDAWREAGIGPSWWALLRALRETVMRDRGYLRGIWFRVTETAVRLRRAGASSVLAVVLLLAAAVGAFLLIQPGNLTAVGIWPVR